MTEQWVEPERIDHPLPRVRREEWLRRFNQALSEIEAPAKKLARIYYEGKLEGWV